MNQIFNEDCLTGLLKLPKQSVNCIVTSPPYFGLRDYGVAGQIGLEQTPQEYVDKLVQVFHACREVLRDDGTLWLNLGDSYAANRTYQVHNTMGASGHTFGKGSSVPEGLKPKDLIGIPWRVAFALQSDGWYLRQDIIWHKPHPMPESVKDRCTKAHEYIFLLSKSPRYYFNAENIREPIKEGTTGKCAVRDSGDSRLRDKEHWSVQERRPLIQRKYAEIKGANKRDVWTVATKPCKEAHFATFPPDLIRPCILSGSPKHGIVLDPFMGAGTTAMVCEQEHRQYVGFELNPQYIEIAKRRIASVCRPQALIRKHRQAQDSLF